MHLNYVSRKSNKQSYIHEPDPAHSYIYERKVDSKRVYFTATATI